jgi:ABC-2 type transport system permease protein
MLNQLLALVAKEWKIIVQQRNVWLTILLVPLIFITVMGAVFGGSQLPTTAIYLVVEEESRLAAEAADRIEDEKSFSVERLADRAGAEARVGQGERMAAVVIPAGFTAATRTNAGGQVDVIVDPARGEMAGMVVGMTQAALAPMLVDAEVTRGIGNAFQQAPDLFGISEDALAAGDISLADIEKFLTSAVKGVVSTAVQDALENPLIKVALTAGGADGAVTQQPGIYDYLVPGYALFFGFYLVGMMAEAMLAERTSGVLRRLQIAPTSRGLLLVGKALPYLGVAMLQMILIFGLSSLLFDYALGNAPAALALVIFAAAASIAGLGMLVAVFARNEGQADAFPSLVVTAMAVVSGSMFPSIRVPGLEMVTPHYWAIRAMQAITVQGEGMAAVLPHVAVLLSIAAVSFAVAAWRFGQE